MRIQILIHNPLILSIRIDCWNINKLLFVVLYDNLKLTFSIEKKLMCTWGQLQVYVHVDTSVVLRKYCIFLFTDLWINVFINFGASCLWQSHFSSHHSYFYKSFTLLLGSIVGKTTCVAFIGWIKIRLAVSWCFNRILVKHRQYPWVVVRVDLTGRSFEWGCFNRGPVILHDKDPLLFKGCSLNLAAFHRQ